MAKENYIAKLSNISKEFPGVKALDDVDFNLKAGEVLALLGENGAGKSTLVKILSGVYSRDAGIVEIFEKEVKDLNAKKAQQLGISIIHQELNMCPHLAVYENIFLGRELNRGIFLNKAEMKNQCREILARLGMEIDPDTNTGDLAVSMQQMVEIAKALSMNAKILIMDEPTSALTAKEISNLFDVINKLKAEGVGIVYISHRLDELQYIADRIMIMRDGKHIVTKDWNKVNISEIISYMVGREIKEKFPRIECEVGKTIFEVKNLNAGPLVRDINLALKEGEIVGIAGLMGAGRTETTRAIFGIDPKTSGEIFLSGEQIEIKKPVDAIKKGIVLVPEDRKKDGLSVRTSIRENIALPNLDLLSNKINWVNKRKEIDMVKRAVKVLTIKLADWENDAASLSGGNQQKVVVGKWLSRESRVVIFDEPTRGIDVGAKVEIYNLMNLFKKAGIGVLFVSSELPEILGMSDRVIVMCDGKITGEFPIDDATQEKIMEAATKFENKFANA